jgi:hypothetical protein
MAPTTTAFATRLPRRRAPARGRGLSDRQPNALANRHNRAAEPAASSHQPTISEHGQRRCGAVALRSDWPRTVPAARWISERMGLVRRDGQLLGDITREATTARGPLSGGRSTIGWAIAPQQAGRLRWALDTGRERDAGRGLRSEPTVECLLTVTPACVAGRERAMAHIPRRSALPPFSRAGSGPPSVLSRTGRLRRPGGLGRRARCGGNRHRPAAC